MLTHSASGKTALQETFETGFNTVLKCIYEKTPAGTATDLPHSCRKLSALMEEHPNHPATPALFAEYIPYLVCAMDYLSRQAERATTDTSAVNSTIQLLLQLYNHLSTGLPHNYMPPESKLPEAFLIQERSGLSNAYHTIEKSWKALEFQLPAAIALEAVLAVIQSPPYQIITWSQWIYAQNLTQHIQQLLNNPINITEERMIQTLLSLRCNTGRFSIWFTQHTENRILQAGSVAEKKSA